MQGQVVAAVVAAVLAAMAAAPGSSVQPPQPQQQQQTVSTAFEVEEDRDAWAALQANGVSHSLVSNVMSNITPTAAGGGGSSIPVAGGTAAMAVSREQELAQGLKQVRVGWVS